MRYYLSRDGHPQGPFTVEELAPRVAAGEIGAATWVCPEGAQTWRSLVAVPELSTLISPSPAAPPTVSSPMPYGGGPLPRFSVGDALRLGWLLLGRRYGLLLLLSLIVFASGALAGIPQQIDQFLHPPTLGAGWQTYVLQPYTRPGTWMTLALNFIVTYPLLLGAMLAAVAVARGERTDVGTVLLPYRRFGHVVLVYLMIALVNLVLAGILVGAVVAAWTGAGAGGTPLLVGAWIGMGIIAVGWWILMLWLTARLWPAILIVADRLYPSIGPFEALRRSWRETRPFQGGLMVVALVVMLLATASALACLVPIFFFGFPFMVATFGVAYAMIFRGAEMGTERAL
ncbi:MAG: DUF4339 domain-containing protein [Phycisphaerales bacterium]